MEALNTTGEQGWIPRMFPLFAIHPSMHEVETIDSLLRKTSMHTLSMQASVVQHQFPKRDALGPFEFPDLLDGGYHQAVRDRLHSRTVRVRKEYLL